MSVPRVGCFRSESWSCEGVCAYALRLAADNGSLMISADAGQGASYASFGGLGCTLGSIDQRPLGHSGGPGLAQRIGQHASHRNLLDQFRLDDVTQGDVDAIVVPTARPTARLGHVIHVAAQLDVTLLLLCSKQSNAGEAASMARRAGVQVVVIDVDRVSLGVLPLFKADKLAVDVGFARVSDLSFKRNLALLFASLAGWRRVVFLDDDVIVPHPGDVRRAAGLLDRYRAVGMKVAGFPDNSVVCHAHRQIGGFQDTYIGGGALAVDTTRIAHFPNIYNEDWFYLLDGNKELRSTAVGEVVQSVFDPFVSRDRAVSEEFGDCLAEGIYALLDMGCSVADATAEYWSEFLDRRRELIMMIIDAVPGSGGEPEMRRHMVHALGAALGRCWVITPSLCVDYLDAWQEDRGTWDAFVAEWLDRCGIAGVDEASRMLGVEWARLVAEVSG